MCAPNSMQASDVVRSRSTLCVCTFPIQCTVTIWSGSSLNNKHLSCIHSIHFYISVWHFRTPKMKKRCRHSFSFGNMFTSWVSQAMKDLIWTQFLFANLLLKVLVWMLPEYHSFIAEGYWGRRRCSCLDKMAGWLAGRLAAILLCFAERHCTNTPARENRACSFQLPLPAYRASFTSASWKWYHPAAAGSPSCFFFI